MTSFHSILCPVDFSDHSVQAFRLAAGLAGRGHGELTALAVAEPLLVEAAATARYGAHYVEDELKKELQALVSSEIPAGAAWAPATRLAVTTGSAHAAILEYAAAGKTDLIVMGTHGLGGYRKMVFGSVTERVLRRSPVPVLVTPRLAHEVVRLSAAEPEFRMATVMAPVDLGPGSAQSVHMAAAMAASLGASLLVVHVVAEVRAPAGLSQIIPVQMELVQESARGQLRQLVADHAPGVRADVKIGMGTPADEIARLATEGDVGLIVMGLTGRDVATNPPGSVAYRVLTMASVPVLAVPGEGRGR